MASDQMMEYYYSMGQDCLHMGDMDEAVTYFRKAANMGAREAAYEIFVLGRQWEKGDGLDKDESKAENCYKISVDYGIEEAGLALGKLYLRGINGNKPNPRKARRMLEHCSDEGSAEAASLLGKIYDEGIMGKVNQDRAFRYYLLAAERGDTSAMLMTGMFYAQGSSTQKDLAAAEMWIRKGRDEGNPDGDMTLRGFLSVACGEYITGAAGSVDPAKAWHRAVLERPLDVEVDALLRVAAESGPCLHAQRYQGSCRESLRMLQAGCQEQHPCCLGRPGPLLRSRHRRRGGH